MSRAVCSVGAMVTACALTYPALAQDVRLVIVSPTSSDYVSDRVTIETRIDPPEAAATISEYVYYVDGKEVCRTASRTPCAWEAGAIVRAHQLRVVASRPGQERLVASVRTRAIDIAEHTAVRRVQVPVVVTDRNGRFVGGLGADAFTLAEDGQAQAISHFSDEDAPLAVELAFDLSDSMSSALPDLKAAVAAFARRMPPSARVSLLAFNDEMFTVGRDGDTLEQRLEILQKLQAIGNTALYDAIVRGLDDVGRASGRRALVVFTDGDDSASRATKAQVREAVEASDASVYFVALGRGREVETLLAGMEELATLSGGRALQAQKIADLDQRFREVLGELSHQYLLGYEPSNPTPDGRWRKIDVRMKNPGSLRLRARTGYRSPTATK